MADRQPTIGRFKILRRIGCVEMATVYLDRKVGLGGDVALKEVASVDLENAPTFAEAR